MARNRSEKLFADVSADVLEFMSYEALKDRRRPPFPVGYHDLHYGRRILLRNALRKQHFLAETVDGIGIRRAKS